MKQNWYLKFWIQSRQAVYKPEAKKIQIYICSKNVAPYIIIFVDGVTMMNRDVSLIAFHQSPPVTYLASPHTTPGVETLGCCLHYKICGMIY